jgi:glycosyltransferase involved in cell wall biosynthesis
VNVLSDILSLRENERGRILALLIFSNLALWIVIFYLKLKSEISSEKFDLLVRNLVSEQTKNDISFARKMKPIMVVIPAFNESDNLRDLIPQMPARVNDLNVGVLVIDDGSSDGTSDVAKQLGCLCVRNIMNRGQGAASRLGYDILVSYGAQVGVTMDADNQHRPEDIEKLVAPILDDQYDLVIGSRMKGDVRTGGFIRHFGIKIFSQIVSTSIGSKLTDCSSGFKAFNKEWMDAVHLREEQFQSAEVIIDAAKKGLRIGEVPISMARRKYGKSKKGADWRYGLNFAKVILKTLWRPR